MFLLLVLSTLLGIVLSSPLGLLRNPQLLEDLNALRNSARHKDRVGDMSVVCGLCGIAVNEVEGFVAENKTVQEIEDYLKKSFCSQLPVGLMYVCDTLVSVLPLLIDQIENTNSVSIICVDLGLCEKPFDNYTDPLPLPKFTLNLDLPPNQRWTQICSVPQYQQMAQFLYNTVKSILPNHGVYFEDLGEELNTMYFPHELAEEIRGCAASLGVPFGWLTLFNLGYEVSDACTSIVAQTPDGKILHARNLDFWDGMGFTATLKGMAAQIDFQKGGKTLFTTSTFAGFVGALSGIKSGGYSVTIDTRFYPDGIVELFYEVIAAITERNASLVTFLTRQVLQNDNDFTSALAALSSEELIADVYYIIAGTKAGEGAVISRNRTEAADVWKLDAPSRWFEVQTNYDHWQQPPWFDNRVDPANDGMNAIGQSKISLDTMMQVLSTKPVFNLQTTYSILACPATGEYRSYTRYCPYPCVE